MGLLDAKQARIITIKKIVNCGAHVQSTALRHCAASVLSVVYGSKAPHVTCDVIRRQTA